MNTQTEKRTKRNLVIFTVMVLGLSMLAWFITPLSPQPVAEPGTAGLGQLVWIISPLLMMILLRTIGGDGWADFGLRPRFKGNGFWWLLCLNCLLFTHLP